MKNKPFNYEDEHPIPINYEYNPDLDGYYDDDLFYSRHNNVMSMTECTGLTATIPEHQSEVDSYNDIYDIPLEPHTKK